MQFISTFDVSAPINEAWELLGDIPRIAPCLPGASVRPIDDDTYEGEVSVKVGPIRAGYAGRATVTRRDEQNHVMVLEGQGSESSGKGTASAVITLTLAEHGPSQTAVEVTTDLTITGRLAQFGRSAMADVSQRLVAQFATNLASLVEGTPATPPTQTPDATSVAGAVSATPPTTAPSGQGSTELDLMAFAGPLVKQHLPTLLGIVGSLALGVLIGGARRRGGQGRPGATSVSPHEVQLLLPVDAIRSIRIDKHSI